MKKLYEDKELTIMAGKKYLYLSSIFGLNLKYRMDQNFNIHTEWNADWNESTSYLEAFVYTCKNK
jgi:hypothetical protein